MQHPRFALTPIQRRDGKTVGQHRHHQASPMSKLESLSGRALELAGSVGDTLRDRVPDRAMKWIETGRSEEHTSELRSLMRISYAVFCLKKKKTTNHNQYLIAVYA